MSDSNFSISCNHVWKVFGSDPDGAVEAASNGASKQQVLEETGHVIAVKDVSFDIRDDEIFVVMGLSGSGKSTLIRCVNRLIEPTKGEIIINGEELASMDERQLRELRRHALSMVFQHFGLLPHRTVEDNVAFGLEVRGEHGRARSSKVSQALDQVGLTEWGRNRVHELSGGMQQRVGLARALAGGADILLMDEPFSALDPLIRRQMQDEFINMRATMKKTVVFITHDLVEALKLGDRVAIMRDGEIVQVDPPQEIVSNPADEYVSEFVKDVPRGQVFAAEGIMERPAALFSADQDLRAAIDAMKKAEVTSGFVTDSRNTVRGVVQLDNAEEQLKTGARTVSEAMRTEFASTEPSTILDQCLPLVADDDVPIAVVDSRGRLLGMVTRPTLFQALQSNGGNGNGNGH